MIGYVYLSSGAIHTSNPGKYPARRDQLDNLQVISDLLGETEPLIIIEKVATIESLDNLPKLRSALARALRLEDRVYIDDFRRIFCKVPFRSRKTMIGSLATFGPIFWEIRGEGRPFGSLKKADLTELIDVTAPASFRLEPRPASVRSERDLHRQTAQARIVSMKKRGHSANRVAKRLMEIRTELLEEQGTATLRAIADAANDRGLRTTRGNRWSPATVKRALDRLHSADDDGENGTKS